MKHIVVLWILGCLLFSQTLSAEDSSVEYKIKAGYLYNFTKFIAWPSDNAGTFNLCIAGDDPFGELIDPIEQRSVLSRPIKLFRFDSLRQLDKGVHCHILFISPSINDKLAGPDFNNSLVVGEGGGFMAQGGMIAFVNKQGKIKLQVNLQLLKKHGLKISAKLLEVADAVKGDGHE